jgi:TPR repeat protein
MSSSILKYADIARLAGVGLKCPVCKGTHCRNSRWHSKQEKLSSEGFRPYRCNDCSHRFLARSSASLERILINGTAGVLLGFGLLAGIEFWIESANEPRSARVAVASPAHSEKGTTGAPARLQADGVAGEAGDDAATRAQKQQDAAEKGDAGAMLELGRDLATGTNRPKDVEQAAKWVQLAAATGNPEGMLELGRFYRDGVGVGQDSARAYAWLSRAAAANHPGALLEREALIRTMSKEKLLEAQQLSSPTEPAAALVRPQ